MSPQIGGIQGSPGSQENLRQVETSGKEPLGRALERAIADGSTVEGVVLRAPKDLGLRGDAPDDTNEDVYILATSVTAR